MAVVYETQDDVQALITITFAFTCSRISNASVKEKILF